MGRPSVAAERTEQIMSATRRCLLQHGIAGTTLERVSQESGLSRSHIRHYVGNRDDLLRSFADELFLGMEQELADVIAAAPADQRLDAATRLLFGSSFQTPTDDDAVIRELMTAGISDPELRALLQQRYEAAVSRIARAARDSYPALTPRRAQTLAFGLWSLAMGSSMMGELGLAEASSSAPRKAADALIAALSS